MPSAVQSPVAETYFHHARPEMLRFVPLDASRILEIGCGAGAFGSSLQARRQRAARPRAQLIGLELDPAAAERARSTFDQVLVGDFYKIVPTLAQQRFDCIIGNDVIEHLVDPWLALTQLRQLLDPGGRLVLSLPNVRFWGVVKDLLWRGAWQYADAGILDRTHLRFFTRSSIDELLRRTKFIDVSIEGINPQLSGWKVSAANALTARRFDDMRYLQFAVHATRAQED